MKKNVGLSDRAVRLVIAVGLIVLAAVHIVPGYWNIITWVMAGILLLTGLFGICPLYGACGVDTRHSDPHHGTN
jgi:DUF2892 family protein